MLNYQRVPFAKRANQRPSIHGYPWYPWYPATASERSDRWEGWTLVASGTGIHHRFLWLMMVIYNVWVPFYIYRGNGWFMLMKNEIHCVSWLSWFNHHLYMFILAMVKINHHKSAIDHVPLATWCHYLSSCIIVSYCPSSICQQTKLVTTWKPYEFWNAKAEVVSPHGHL